jgi:hypothetical protein
MKDAGIPPVFSGHPSDDRTRWAEFADEYRRTHAELHAGFDDYCRDRGAPGLPGLELMHESPWLNLYLYPDELDYARSAPLAPTWHNLQASVRATDAPWEPPADGDAALVYLSLGSLGAGDVALMQRLIDVLAATRFRVIVSMGPRHELATSMEALIHHFKLVTEGFRVPPGEAYYPIESPRGELGCFVRADGSSKPARVHMRDPSFVNLQAMKPMVQDGYIADLIATLAMLDPILGGVDR